MARSDGITDPALRALLEQAQAHLRGGDPTAAVRRCSDAFLRLLALKPDLLEANLPRDDLIHHRQWPHLGATLAREHGRPVITYERQRFATADAITYYEFALDAALKAGA